MARARRGDREKTSGKGARILIVEARFYDDIADALLAGATKVLKEAGAQFDCLTVPGSLEIPCAIAIAHGISSEPGTVRQSNWAPDSFRTFVAPASSASAMSS